MSVTLLRHKGLLATALLVIILICDQLLKIWVKTHFYLGEEVRIFPWFRLVFIENNGMAFGMEFGSKFLLTTLRLLAVGVGFWYLWRLSHRRSVPVGYILCIALIVAGALGNILDCMFYGLIFNNPMPPYVADFVPFGHGYAPAMLGRVVDMLYFPLFSFHWPDWIPAIGGQRFIFFQPVFNLADAAISVGIVWLIIGYGNNLNRVGSIHDTPFSAASHND